MSPSAPLSVAELPALSHGQLAKRVVEIEEQVFSEPWALADFELLASDERAVNLGLWCGERLVGYAIAYVESAELHLASLAVEEEHRRQGWGTHLLQHMLARGVERGCTVCRLEVRESNRPAVQLYSTRGFDVVGRRRRFYSGPVEDALVMTMPIGRPLTRGLDSNAGTD